ncbi:mediator of RNA polymerase II transcription subunit 15 [Ananas comosus]|uniref:Mediator of RNA polymerase II transcription subunit 15 n=1 Tax=Ananas comosus TaxID=4615 RepID=A0A6P5ENF3_ANACO|nr:mediator of RNA polymerase II transcription subunit 15 [Ananas comosus]
MQQPSSPTSLPSSPSPSPSPPPPPSSSTNGPGKKPKLPSPEEVLAHYEAQGLDPRAASLKVIGELQSLLFRALSGRRGKKDRFMADAVRKLDNVNTRLAIAEMKLDSKPSRAEALAIGVAAGALVRGAEHVLPHVLGALGALWGSVAASTGASPHPPPPPPFS